MTISSDPTYEEVRAAVIAEREELRRSSGGMGGDPMGRALAEFLEWTKGPRRAQKKAEKDGDAS